MEGSRQFFEKWQQENLGKNKYDPEVGERTVLFSSGMGDGMYSGYWGLDEEGKAVCLAVVFMNPEFF